MQQALTADASHALPAANDSKADKGKESREDSTPYIERAWITYYRDHRNQVVCATIGLLVAAGFLIIGFWPTLLLAVFISIGVLYGRYKDGDRKMMVTVKNVIDRLD